MRIETINYNNIEHAFPCLAQRGKIVDSDRDIEKSIQWIMKSMHNGFRGTIAFDGFKKPIGTIFYGPLQYLNIPIESNVNVMYLRCLYVDPEKRGTGIGATLVSVMKKDSRDFAGIVARGDAAQSELNVKNLKDLGFKTALEQDGAHYMFLPIRADGIKLKVIPLRYKPIGIDIEITLFNDGFCPVENHKLSQVRRIARTFGDAVSIRELDLAPMRARQYGTSAVCLIDGEDAFSTDASDEAIRTKIQSAISKRLIPKGVDAQTQSAHDHL